jgi:membrane protein implicated in regulation of membrane protease activity
MLVGLVLVVLAIVLVLAEAHLTTGGVIASGAIVALVSGVTVILLAAGATAATVLAVAAVVGGISLTGLIALVRRLAPVRLRRPRAGVEAMVGHVGVVRASNSAPRVFVDGALWRAQSSPLEEVSALHDGDQVVVERVSGLTLCVRKAEEWELNL